MTAITLKVDESRLPGVTVYATQFGGVHFIARRGQYPWQDKFLYLCPHCDRTTWAFPGDDLDWPRECVEAMKALRSSDVAR